MTSGGQCRPTLVLIFAVKNQDKGTCRRVLSLGTREDFPMSHPLPTQLYSSPLAISVAWFSVLEPWGKLNKELGFGENGPMATKCPGACP
jgi:hypothetical protein